MPPPIVEISHVDFAYREGQPVVRDFNITVPGGSVVALVGRSGAGKTTVTDLVARFHDPTAGRILANGRDIREFRLKSYRRLLAIVQQEVFLFDGSVRDNIAYGRHDAMDAEIERKYQQQVYPKLREFKPDLVMISAGFDAHELDPLGQLRMTTDGFDRLTLALFAEADAICQGRVVVVTEGGYDLTAVSQCLTRIVESSRPS